MKIGLFGNCQAAAMGRILTDHLIGHEIIVFKAVHTMSEFDKLSMLQQLPFLDVLIHQPVGEVYYPACTSVIKQHISNTKVKSVVFPVLYFSGYFYDMIYLKDIEGKTVRNFIADYHSRIFFSSFVYGEDYNKCSKLYFDDNDFIKQQTLKNAQLSIKELKNRESDCDIKIGDF